MSEGTGQDVGVLAAVDGSLGLSALQHPLRTLRYRVEPARDRRSVLGVAGVLRMLARTLPEARFCYVSSSPRPALPYIRRALRHDGYPPGRLEHARTARQVWQGHLFKRDVLDRLLREEPRRRWVLLGDDGDDDPAVFSAAARRFPDQVLAVAIRHLAAPDGETTRRMRRRAGQVPVMAAGTGEELMPELVAALGLHDPRTPVVLDWFLTPSERGNDSTAVRPWTEGNAVTPLVHGRTYFPALDRALAVCEPGDRVLLGGWRADADELLRDEGPTAAGALARVARRGVSVRGLLWRSHHPAIGFSSVQNRHFAREVNAAGAEVLLDHRVRPLGSHHQKFVVVRHPRSAEQDVAFVGGLDLARARRDGADHRGDDQTRSFAPVYGPTPPWHDVQLAIRGPGVGDVEEVFRERWADPAPLVLGPWRAVRDRRHRVHGPASPMPAPGADPPAAGTCAVQLLRTYPQRRPAYPFAPQGERSVARAYAKALNRARRIVYVEDQYLWSTDVARVFATALERSPDLQLIAVVPRYPDQESPLRVPTAMMGQSAAMDMVREAGGDRVQVVDLEAAGTPVYVHAKLCIVDDVWAAVGSANLSRRSWTHDSELVAAVLDDERDEREPRDPAGRGDQARRFARELRLALLREHLGRAEGDDADLVAPEGAMTAVREAAAAMDRWYDSGCRGPRPPGRLRHHVMTGAPRWERLVTALYTVLVDPDGRPLDMALRRTF